MSSRRSCHLGWWRRWTPARDVENQAQERGHPAAALAVDGGRGVARVGGVELATTRPDTQAHDGDGLVRVVQPLHKPVDLPDSPGDTVIGDSGFHAGRTVGMDAYVNGRQRCYIATRVSSNGGNRTCDE